MIDDVPTAEVRLAGTTFIVQVARDGGTPVVGFTFFAGDLRTGGFFDRAVLFEALFKNSFAAKMTDRPAAEDCCLGGECFTCAELRALLDDHDSLCCEVLLPASDAADGGPFCLFGALDGI